jgi:hypothetical protein
MDGVQSNEAGSSLVSITVLSVTPLRAGRLFALASVEIDIDGVRIEVRGIRAMRVPTGATRVELPTFRDASGQSRAALVLPDEVHGPVGDAVIEALGRTRSRQAAVYCADPGLITARRRCYPGWAAGISWENRRIKITG